MMVGPPGFEPGSIAPEATSLDQASRGPRLMFRRYFPSPANKIKIAIAEGHYLVQTRGRVCCACTTSLNQQATRLRRSHKNRLFCFKP